MATEFASSHGQIGGTTIPFAGGASTGLAAGRAPPHSPEAEEHLLGCCLLDGEDSIARCLELRLPAEAFYSPANQVIYEKVCAIYQRSPPVDVAVLAEELGRARISSRRLAATPISRS